MIIEEVRRNPFYSQYEGRTREIPRPTGNEPELRHVHYLTLQRHQEAWDGAQAVHDARVWAYTSNAAQAAIEEADLREKEAQRAATTRANADAAILTPALEAFKRSGGTDEEFAAVKETILTQARAHAALTAAQKAATPAPPPRQNLIG